LYAGESTPDDCLSEVQSDRKTEKEQRCKTFYHIGAYYLIEGDNNKAIEYFEKCIATGEIQTFEINSAKILLARLKQNMNEMNNGKS
jgi:lipoprotein NlpI